MGYVSSLKGTCQVDSSLSDYVTKLGGEEAWRWWLHGMENYWWLHFVQYILYIYILGCPKMVLGGTTIWGNTHIYIYIYIYIPWFCIDQDFCFCTFKSLVVGGFIVHNLSCAGAAVFSFFGDTSSYWRPGGWGEQTEAANFQTRLNLMSSWRQNFPHWARNFGSSAHLLRCWESAKEVALTKFVGEGCEVFGGLSIPRLRSVLSKLVLPEGRACDW